MELIQVRSNLEAQLDALLSAAASADPFVARQIEIAAKGVRAALASIDFAIGE